MTAGYRTSHAAERYGATYNQVYQRGYYAAQWRDVEERLLDDTFARLGGPDVSCMDFACGTGRITGVAVRHFGKVVGVDVSTAMLVEARKSVDTQFVQQDLTRTPLDEAFDVALAFRFFLNAEHSLRQEALRAIRRQLRPGGALVCNIHMSATAPMGWAYGLKRAVTGNAHKTMSEAAFVTLLNEEGFSVESITGYSFMPRPGPLLPGLAGAMVAPVEKLAKGLHLPRSLAQCFLVVARKA